MWADIEAAENREIGMSEPQASETTNLKRN